jgi:hypothetical protein
MILTNHGIIQSFKIGEQLYLNTYPAGMGGYSMYKIDINYTGSCLRVRRSSDNTESDIGFDVSGALDESALLSFVGTGGTDNGYVTKWYVQGFTNDPTSIYNLDLTNTNSATQMLIVNGGSVCKYDSKPAIQSTVRGQRLGRSFNTSSTRPASLSWHIVLKYNYSAIYPEIIPVYAGSNQYAGVGDDGSGTAIVYRDINGNGVSTPPTSGTYKNGTSVTVTTRDQMHDQFYAPSISKFTVWSAYGLAPGSNWGSSINFSGYASFGGAWYGYIGEMIFHLSNEVSNNTGETDNIKTRWGI